MKMTVGKVFSAVLMALASSIVHPSPGPGSAADLNRAQQILTSAISALSGDASTPRTVEVEFRGTGYSWYQGASPGVPATIEYRRVQQLFDWAADEITMIRDFRGRTFAFETGTVRRLMTGDPAHTTDVILIPHAVVHQMLQEPESLLVLRTSDTGASVSGTINGERVELDLDSRHLPITLRHRYHDLFVGDAIRTVEYTDYAANDGLRMPQSVRRHDAGRLAFELTIQSFGSPDESPSWTERAAALISGLVNTGRDPGISQFADGIYLVEIGDPVAYRAVLVESESDLMMLDAPQWLGDGNSLREAIDEFIGQSLTAVALSHHHSDHSVGLLPLAFDGIKVVTTPGNAQWLDALLRAPRTIPGFIGTNAAEVLLVEGSRDLGDVVAYDAGPSDHADEHLVFYMPNARAVFQSDMGSFGPDGGARLNDASCALLAAIDGNQLDVEIVIGSHGEVGPMAAFRRALNEREGGC